MSFPHAGSFDETDNPWPALSDLLASTTLIFLVLFAVIAVPALRARTRAIQVSSTLDTLEASVKRNSFDVQRFGDYLLVTIKSDAVFPKDDFELEKLKPEGRDQLRRFGESLRANHLLDEIDQIQIVGHTSREGGDEYNMRLSSQRAATVAFFLIREAQLPPCEVTALGRGSFYPVDPVRAKKDTTANPLDRRIEIELRPRILDDSAQNARRANCVSRTH